MNKKKITELETLHTSIRASPTEAAAPPACNTADAFVPNLNIWWATPSNCHHAMLAMFVSSDSPQLKVWNSDTRPSTKTAVAAIPASRKPWRRHLAGPAATMACHGGCSSHHQTSRARRCSDEMVPAAIAYGCWIMSSQMARQAT